MNSLDAMLDEFRKRVGQRKRTSDKRLTDLWHELHHEWRDLQGSSYAHELDRLLCLIEDEFNNRGIDDDWLIPPKP